MEALNTYLPGVKSCFLRIIDHIRKVNFVILKYFYLQGENNALRPALTPELIAVMTSADFSAAGFEPCDAPPPCWLREPGPFYTQTQAGSTAFVRYLAAESNRHDEIEAFGGNWQQPWATGTAGAAASRPRSSCSG